MQIEQDFILIFLGFIGLLIIVTWTLWERYIEPKFRGREIVKGL